MFVAIFRIGTVNEGMGNVESLKEESLKRRIQKGAESLKLGIFSTGDL